MFFRNAKRCTKNAQIGFKTKNLRAKYTFEHIAQKVGLTDLNS